MPKKIVLKSILNLLLCFVPPIFNPKLYNSTYKGIIRDFISIIFGSPKHGDNLILEKCNYNRIAFIQKIISLYDFDSCKYLEIGTNKNTVFDSIPLKSSNKFGIDPYSNSYGAIKKTSNEFFSTNTEKFDIIFIDGLHIYRQCKLDVINSLKFVKKKTYLVLHDVLPVNKYQEKIPRTHKIWTGDVWKVAVELANSKNLRFCVANCDHGVAIAEVSPDTEYIIIPELKNKNFYDYLYHYHSTLPIVRPEEALYFIK